VEFAIRFRRESALEETLADTLTTWRVELLLLSEVPADQTSALLSRRANANVLSPADLSTRVTTLGAEEAEMLLTTTTTAAPETLACAMPSRRASASVVPVADTVTRLEMLLRTVEPSPTSLPTARLVSAMPSREESVTVVTVAASVTVVPPVEMVEVTELLVPRALAMRSREASVREATSAATLTRLSRLKAIQRFRTINRTIKLGGLWSSVSIAVGWI